MRNWFYNSEETKVGKNQLFTLILLVFCLETSAQASRLTYKQLNKLVGLYQKTEWDIKLQEQFADPYNSDEIKLDMIISTPSGRHLALPCYFNGNIVGEPFDWKARFAPQETGEYTYFFRMVTKSAIYNTGKDTFSAFWSGKNGMLHVNNFWTLKYDSGKLLRGIGENIGWEAREVDNPAYTYNYFLPQLKKMGGNFFRTFMNNWNLPLEWNITTGEPRRENNRYKNSAHKYHAAGIKRMDEFVTLCDSLNLHMMLMIEWQNNLRLDHNWSKNPYNIKNGGMAATPTDFFTNIQAKTRFKDRLRYMIARWGYSPAIGAWELMNEVDNAAYDKYKDVDGKTDKDVVVIPHESITGWHSEMAAYLKANDPYRHIVTTSISHRQIKGLFEIADIDINQQHIYRRTDSIPITILEKEQIFDKPLVIGEFGFRWENGDPKYWDDYYFHFKKGLWYGLFSPTPILPLTWWWELFDANYGLKYLKSVSEINKQMLAAGKGIIKVIDSENKDIITKSVLCGNKSFSYLLNNKSTKVFFSFKIKAQGERFKVQIFNPEKLKYHEVQNVECLDQEIIIRNLEMKSREQFIVIIEYY